MLIQSEKPPLLLAALGSILFARLCRGLHVRDWPWLRLRWLFCLLLGCIVYHPALAAAGQPSSAPADAKPQASANADAVRRFTEHVRRGLEAFNASRWDESLSEYWAAYAINPNPHLLFNAAQAHRRAGRWDDALSLYERFIREDPGNPIVPEAEAHAVAMRANRDRDKAQQLAAVRDAEAAKIAEANDTLRAKVNQLMLSGQLAPKVRSYRRRWFWGVLGGGTAAALGLALGLGIGLRPILPSSEQGARMIQF